MEFGSFGSTALWLLFTFPAYWLFQWIIEGEPFSLYQRRPVRIASIGEGMSPTIVGSGNSLVASNPGQLAPAEAA